jgi:beta-glucanase (GH16 family)
VGQQPVRPGAVVREEQPAHWGWTPRYGRLEMRARATVTPRSMVAWWLVGFEDSPERSGELCVVEVFGDAVDPVEGAAVGMGVHPFRDPRLVDDFAAPRPGIDVAEWHTYAVDWRPGGAVFSVDGAEVRRVAVAPDYPVQTMLAVFDFPEKAVPGEPYVVPELVVDRIGGESG